MEPTSHVFAGQAQEDPTAGIAVTLAKRDEVAPLANGGDEKPMGTARQVLCRIVFINSHGDRVFVWRLGG